LGFELFNVQRGYAPSDFKPMAGVGSGVFEIRIHGQNEHRALYVAKFAEAIYVLHVFEKKTQQTSRMDMEIGKRRYSEMLVQRLQEGFK